MVKKKESTGLIWLFIAVTLILAAVVAPITIMSGKADTPPPAPAVSGTGGVTPSSSAPPPVSASSAPEDVSAPGLLEPEFYTVSVSEKTALTGDLILVNPDNEYTFPDSVTLVKISDVKSDLYRVSSGDMQLSETIILPLNSMMYDFYNVTGVKDVTIISAYRTYEYQRRVLDGVIAQYGKKEAAKRAAEPGYSEHHTGLAFDLGIYSKNGMETFKGSGKYRWIPEHCTEYGFILRYPSGKTDITGTMNEPWHFRYVGNPHAQIITQNGLCLEEYYDYLRPYDSCENALTATFGGVDYWVFYSAQSSFRILSGKEYAVSGADGGFIVTMW